MLMERQGRPSSWRYATSTRCTPNFASAGTRSSTRASGQVLRTSGSGSSSILLPTGFASTSPHQPGKAPAPASAAPLDYQLATLRGTARSEEHTSELQSLRHLVCRLLLEKT